KITKSFVSFVPFCGYSPNSMQGKSIILAGGSGGLGATLAEELAARGAIPVIGCKHNRERAHALARKLLEKYGVVAPVVVGDILDQTVRLRMIDAGKSSGSLYGMVPLVGQPARVPVETATEQDLMDSLRDNFVGPVLLARDFAAALGVAD